MCFGKMKRLSHKIVALCLVIGLVPFAPNDARAIAGSATLGPVNRIDFPQPDGFANTCLIDSTRGFAYFATNSNKPAHIIKVNLSGFTREATLILDSGEKGPAVGAIDPNGEFGYFGLFTSPGRIVKVQLSNMTRVASLTLPSDEGYFTAATIDNNGLAYFVTAGKRIVRLRTADLTRLDGLDVRSSTQFISAGTDFANGFAYFGNQQSPDELVQVRLADFRVMLKRFITAASEGPITDFAIDSAAGVAYLAVQGVGAPARVIKVQLSNMTRLETLVLEASDPSPTTIDINPASNRGYVGLPGNPGRVLQIGLNPLQRVGSPLILSSNVNTPICSGIDLVRGLLVLGTAGGSAEIARVRLHDFVEEPPLPLNLGQGEFFSSFIDLERRFAYFLSFSYSKLIRVRLSDFTVTGALPLPFFGIGSSFSVFDKAANVAYTIRSNRPDGPVVKIDLNTLTITNQIPFSLGGRDPRSMVVDERNRVVYVGTDGRFPSASMVFRFSLSDFAPLGSLAMPTNLPIAQAFIDEASEFAYFFSFGAKIMKVRLADFSLVGSLTLPPEEGNVRSGVLRNNVLSLATENTVTGGGDVIAPLNRIVQIDVATLTRTRALDLPATDRNLTAATADQERGLAYFAMKVTPFNALLVDLDNFRVLDRVALRDAGGTPVSYDTVERSAAVFDPAERTAYFGTSPLAGSIIKVGTQLVGAAPPKVSLVSPNGLVLPQPATFPIVAETADTDGRVVKVEFFQGEARLGEVTTPPFSFTLTRLPAGVYRFTARATDNDGLSTNSDPLTVAVLGETIPRDVNVIDAGHPLAVFYISAGPTDSLNVSVMDIRTNRLKTLTATQATASMQTFTWDGRNESGVRMPRGRYIFDAVSPKGRKRKSIFIR